MISKMVADIDVQANREGNPVGVVYLGEMGRATYRRSVCRRSSSGHGRSSFSSFKLRSKLIVIVIQLLFLSSFCRGHVLGHVLGHVWSWSPITEAAGRSERRSVLASPASAPNYCTKLYTAVAGETCASLRTTSDLSQAQIFEINPGLNCKTLSKGQSICVEGISAHCATTVSVTKGSNTPTCASLAAGNLSSEGFLVLNPGISCPEASGNHNSWPQSQLVCVAPGLSNLFAEYIGASGLPITFADVQLLYKRYPSVIKHVILAFAIDLDSNGKRTNGVFHPYWNSNLTSAAAAALKAGNSNIRLLISLGGPSNWANSSWEDPSSPTEWIDTAQASLTTITQEYSIDGIDIAYESFPQGSANFSYCIGTLIQRLKGNNTIGLATTAPSGPVIQEYLTLKDEFTDQIDYMNFQFYSYELPTVDSYVSEFSDVADTFGEPWKLLASTQIGGKSIITGLSFLKAVETIRLARGLVGVMLYDADHSVGNNFHDENLDMSLLDGEPYSRIINSTLGPALAPSPVPSSGPGPARAPGPSFAPALSPGAPNSSPPPGSAPGSSKAPALAPGSAPGSSKAPALGPGAPHSSFAPGLAPGSSKAPGLGPGAPHSSLAPGRAPGSAPGSSKAPALGPGAPHSSLAPGLAPRSSSPALGPGGPQSSSTPRLAPGSSLAPAAPAGSSSGPGAAEGPPSKNSAPNRSRWPSQRVGLFTAVVVLLFSM